jgi:hypothetical protein
MLQSVSTQLLDDACPMTRRLQSAGQNGIIEVTPTLGSDALHAATRHYPVFHRRPYACGTLYEVVAYVAIFQVLALLVFNARPVAEPS